MRISMLIGPRPVCLIGTWDERNKRTNLMTASFVMPVSFAPSYVAFAVAPSRYTWELLKEVPEFTINMLTNVQEEISEICGSYSGRDVDKFKEANITPVKSEKIKPHWVKECPVAAECMVEFTKLFGDHYIVVGKIVAEHINNTDYKPLLHWSGMRYETTR